ncbi:MAG: MerR family transcriptional regulator [Anaerolineaceae bacterium]
MYTVKQVSKIAGTTSRTLHYYDKIGLLKPNHIGSNGYRYYDDGSLMRLQQILLFRELDMPLEQIKLMLDQPDFDLYAALENHKAELKQRANRIERLVVTVEHTQEFLKGKREMSKEQLFDVFNEEQQVEYEKEATQKYDPKIVKASNEKWKNYSAAEKQRIGEEGNAVYRDIVEVMPKGAASPEVQACITRWRKHMEYFWIPNDKQLLAIAEGYSTDPRFKSNFDKIHPELATFMLQAVTVYIENRQH